MALFILVGGTVVMLLWNWLLPALFGWPELTFWQALALLALCRILFGGHGVGRSTRSRIGRRVDERIAERMAERMEGMTPDERERFRQGLRRRCGLGASAADSPESPATSV
jgi:membrane protein required for beta-lactamase induction